MKVYLLVCLMMILSSGCDDPGDKDGKKSGSVGENSLAGSSISLTSETLSNSNLNLSESETGSSCSFQLDIYQGRGLCITPLNVTGYANNLVGENSGISNPDIGQARLAGVSGATDGEGLIFNGAEFNLAEKKSFTGYNELWFNYSNKTEFTHLRLDLIYQKIQFKVLDQYVTMIIAASDQPFKSSSALESCSVSEDEKTQARFTKADLLTGLTFKRGDYLFCLRADTTSCEPSEFKWLDTTSGSLVDSRPQAPRVHKWLVNDPITCNREGDSDRYDFSLTGLVFGASLSSPVTLYADWSHGINSVQYKDGVSPLSTQTESETEEFEEPYPLYYSKIDGVSQTGSRMNQTYNFNLTDMIYVEGLEEGEMDDFTVEQLLSKIWTKHDWVFEKKAATNTKGYGIDQISSATATPSIVLSGGTSRPN